MENQNDLLWNRKKVDYTKRGDLSYEDMRPLFHGIYPEVFHGFAEYGIYVFKLFVRERWVYVLVDSKLPCNIDQ